MDGIESSTPTTEPECRRCGLKNAQGLRTIYRDGLIDWKCGACGRTMRIGEMEHSAVKGLEERKGRERAQENRDRYRREQFDATVGSYKKKMEEGEALPSAKQLAQEAGKILDPSYEEKPDTEKDDEMEVDGHRVQLAEFSA